LFTPKTATIVEEHPTFPPPLSIDPPTLMPSARNRPIPDLVRRTRAALKLQQPEFAAALGVSLRTAQRWEGGETNLLIVQARRLAILVFPHNRELARELATAARETLESLKLVPPAPPPQPPVGLLVEAVVCAAADAGGLPPRAARATLLAALRRMRDLGVTADQLSKELESAG
jgi:transcriptional regulator with XRE-family HTH domain